MNSQHDALIIGAGMSGLAAGIRMSMFGLKVCLLEKHSIGGGLNSYYQRGKRKFDVGLHALTNFATLTKTKEDRRKPLLKLLRQLDIPLEELHLQEQKFSQIVFADTTLRFNNQWEFLLSEIQREFPHQVDAFIQLGEMVRNYQPPSLFASERPAFLSAKEVVGKIITESLLLEMIFCPLLIYGSAWEHDMDFSQFVVMFQSLYLEGLSRPDGGVRRILDLLTEKFLSLGGELRFRAPVKRILLDTAGTRAQGVELISGECLFAEKIFSSAGLVETLHLCSEVSPASATASGRPL